MSELRKKVARLAANARGECHQCGRRFGHERAMDKSLGTLTAWLHGFCTRDCQQEAVARGYKLQPLDLADVVDPKGSSS